MQNRRLPQTWWSGRSWGEPVGGRTGGPEAGTTTITGSDRIAGCCASVRADSATAAHVQKCRRRERYMRVAVRR